jgi:hypothetical protein
MAKKKTTSQELERVTDAGRGVTYVENQMWQLVPPWLAAGGLYAAGQVGHLMWGSEGRTPWATAALTAGTCGLTCVATIAGKARGPLTRALAGGTTAASGIWMIASTITGAFHDPLWWMFPLVAAPVAVAWNIKKLLRGQGDDAHNADDGGQWGELGEDIKVLKSKILSKRQVGATQKVKLELPAGMTQAAAANDLAALSSVYRTPPTGMRMVPDPDDGRVVELSITPEDVLRASIPWPGPCAAGQSISVPIIFGQYEDGQPLQLLLPGKRGGRVVSHILLMGMSGAGKSEAILLLVTEILTRIDTEVYYLDIGGKAEQTIRPIKSGLSKLATTRDEAEALLEELVAEVPERAAHLASKGLTEWAEGCGLPFRVVVIDEGADLVSGNADFVELARKLRSVGVLLVLAIQRATHNQMPTEARANFGTVLCFGVRRPADEGFALSDETIEAGAKPSAWANRKPGYSYLEDNGIDPMRYSIPARTFLPDYDDLERIVTGCAPIRWKGNMAVTSAFTGTAASTRSAGQPPSPRPRRDDEPPVRGYEPPEGIGRELDGIDPNADLDDGAVDLDQPIGPPPRRLTTEQALAAFDQLLDAFEQRGIEQFSRADLIGAGALDVTGRRKGWISGVLGDQVAAGRLYDVTGDRADGIYGFTSMRASENGRALANV